MKLTIELDAEYGISVDDKLILRALAGIAQDLESSNVVTASLHPDSKPVVVGTALSSVTAESQVILPRVLAPGETLESGEIASKITNDNVAQISQRADLSDPKTQAATSAVAPANEELDPNGLPWDARIHSSGKTRLKKDDSWKYKAGIKTKQPGLIEQVETENKARIAAQGGAEVVIGAVEQTAAQAAFGGGGGGGDDTQITPITFPQLLTTVTSRIQSNSEYANTVNAVLVEFELEVLPQLHACPDLVAPIAARLDELWQG